MHKMKVKLLYSGITNVVISFWLNGPSATFDSTIYAIPQEKRKKKTSLHAEFALWMNEQNSYLQYVRGWIYLCLEYFDDWPIFFNELNFAYIHSDSQVQSLSMLTNSKIYTLNGWRMQFQFDFCSFVSVSIRWDFHAAL